MAVETEIKWLANILENIEGQTMECHYIVCAMEIKLWNTEAREQNS